jgi:hypothetical protein
MHPCRRWTPVAAWTRRARALAALLALSSSLAFAAPETYRGALVGKTLDQPAPIPLVLTVDILGTRILGRAVTSSPLPGSGSVEGEQSVSQCAMRAELGNGTILNLRGRCDAAGFEGVYAIRFRSGQSWHGTFKVQKASVPGRAVPRVNEPAAPTRSEPESPGRVTTPRSRTDCLGAKHSCLVGCRVGDPAAEILCADRCKRRHDACIAKSP